MNVLAFIPARAGSKGIPGKNMVELGGKPLIQHTIEAARKSKCVSEIFVSSDDQGVLELCAQLGLPVPYRRPRELSEDSTPMIETVIHGLTWLGTHRDTLPDAVLLLQPTSPFRDENDIDGAIKLFTESKATSVIGVHPVREHPFECIDATRSPWTYLAHSSEIQFRRQDYMAGYFFINGAIYLVDTKLLMRERRFCVEGGSLLYTMSEEHGLDIDTPQDLWLARVRFGDARLEKSGNL